MLALTAALALQNLVEKILRMKIYNTTYWKEHCFGLTAASVVEKVCPCPKSPLPAPVRISTPTK